MGREGWLGRGWAAGAAGGSRRRCWKRSPCAQANLVLGTTGTVHLGRKPGHVYSEVSSILFNSTWAAILFSLSREQVLLNGMRLTLE